MSSNLATENEKVGPLYFDFRGGVVMCHRWPYPAKVVETYGQNPPFVTVRMPHGEIWDVSEDRLRTSP